MTRLLAGEITVQDKGVQILHPTDLVIEPGLTIIAGPSGSGKSTLASVLFGLRTPDTGKVAHVRDGEVVFRNDAKARTAFGARAINALKLESSQEKAAAEYRRRQLGFIAQNPYFPEHVEVGRYIGLVQEALGLPIDEQQMGKLYEQLGVGADTRKTTSELSGGELQRFAIALGVGGKDLVFGDEPEASLDTENKANLWQILSKISNPSSGEERTVVAVSHDERARDFANQVIFMRDGEVTDIQHNNSLSQ